jgi:hypothetical protein
MTIIVPAASTYGPVSIVDYATLLTSVSAWVNRADLAAAAADFVSFGEARIYRDLRVAAMEATFSTAIAAGVVAVPTGYIEMKNARISGGIALVRKDAEWIYARYPTRTAEGEPRYFAREAQSLIFGPYPDSNYTVNGCYYKRLTSLSGTNTTNWLITDAPDLILFAALCEAAPYLQDDTRIALWEKKYAQIKDRVQRNDEQEEFSGSPLAATVR